MNMAADPKMGIPHRFFPSSFGNQNQLSFTPGLLNSTESLVEGGFNILDGISGTESMMLGGNPCILNNSSSTMLQGNPQGNLLLDHLSGLKHDTGLAVDWSYKEQAILNYGLIIYSNQPSVKKYIKIAALLPEKTARNVALRCRWLSNQENGKRQKLEEYCAKKFKDKKDKIVDSSAIVNIHQYGNTTGYTSVMDHVNHKNHFLTEAPIIDDATRKLFEENTQTFFQIASNLESLKTQDNLDLFLRSRNNIKAILNSLSGMPGIMSQMLPLPVTINEDLITTILPRTSQRNKFSSTGITMKQEPRF